MYEGAVPAVVGEDGSFSESRLRIAAKLVVDPPEGLLFGGAYGDDVAKGCDAGAVEGGTALGGLFAPSESCNLNGVFILPWGVCGCIEFGDEN